MDSLITRNTKQATSVASTKKPSNTWLRETADTPNITNIMVSQLQISEFYHFIMFVIV